MPIDISVVVPCHNGAPRLPATLSHIAAQRVPDDLRWEVIVVDNASTDGTGRVAAETWPPEGLVPLRVVHEGRLGLAYAHLRGFAEAKGDIIVWVEDDNWIAPDWLAVVADVMRRHPEVGACGGLNEPVTEAARPAWFETFQSAYAIGPQGDGPADITDTRGYLWGAGLTVRKAAWDHLTQHGFRPLLVDRQGTKLNSGGDSEICFALRLAGWRLRFEPRLRLRHFLLTHRLDWWYLRRLYRGFGASTVGFDPYQRALGCHPGASGGRRRARWLAEALRTLWLAEALRTLIFLCAHARKVLVSRHHALEGDPEVVTIEFKLGRLVELVRKRGAYDASLREVARAPWRRPA